ncbi:sigma-70 family RNA polymerase sigma factor [Cyclobacterium jeungdonense]|uniref:Sigma-70 family RNA polymerase sigma factor n=1 Tax=Cyclobacterium jeungdonense TaxID=708087 RepID=A0ABT8CB50_9BACT|nr:sigma-70 family RNA polymerase sigma factor [Cyclobacterium jeungdonense]MDN3690034.1 sigma-70 family RNA polymerase sigma factor [Cyclobacterium jeungdonense]
MNQAKNNSELFILIAEGNKNAFDEFFELFYTKLVNFSKFILEDKGMAEDVVSEVLTNLLIDKERVFRMKNFEAYLYTAVKNKSLTKINKHRKELKIECGDEDNNHFIYSITPHQLLEEQELNHLIQSLVNNLPKKRKMVFQLIKDDELTYRQVGEIMEISERTVEVHLKLAIRSFREEINRYFDRKMDGKKLSKIS